MIGNPPLYRQIYDDIAHKISTGEMAYKDQLPVLPELCRLYGVSEAPVRRALDELERAGMIVRQRGRGKGTFVDKRLAPRTVRVLLMDEIDIYRSKIEYVHEIFDMIAGIRDSAGSAGAEVAMISTSSLDTLTAPGGQTGYLIIAQSKSAFERGARLAAEQNSLCVLVNPPAAIEPCVRVDMELGAFHGVNYLAQLGHRRIAYLGPRTGEWFGPRFAGYRRALEKYEIGLDERLVLFTDGATVAQDEAALDSLMALGEDAPTAIFAASDYRALHLLGAARRRGLAIPRQLSLCGYDDISEVASVDPALTTVRHPHYELGRAAVDLLSRLLANEPDDTVSKDVLLSPQVVVRASCAPPQRGRDRVAAPVAVAA